MNYQEMSDEEIDLAVSEIIFGKTLGRRTNYTFDKAGFVFTGSGHFFTPLDNENVVFTPKIKPTSSWADAGPIIQDNKISIIHDCMAEPQDGGCWLARPTYGYEHEKSRSDNPLRSAMVLFLMMKGGE